MSPGRRDIHGCVGLKERTCVCVCVCEEDGED